MPTARPRREGVRSPRVAVHTRPSQRWSAGVRPRWEAADGAEPCPHVAKTWCLYTKRFMFAPDMLARQVAGGEPRVTHSLDRHVALIPHSMSTTVLGDLLFDDGMLERFLCNRAQQHRLVHGAPHHEATSRGARLSIKSVLLPAASMHSKGFNPTACSRARLW